MTEVLDPKQITAEEIKTDPIYLLLSSLLITEYHLQIMENLQQSAEAAKKKMNNIYLRNGCKLVVQELKRSLAEKVDDICYFSRQRPGLKNINLL